MANPSIVFAANQTAVTSVDGSATKVASARTGRISLIVKLASAATACVTCGPSATDDAFQLCAGESISFSQFSQMFAGDVYCVAVSGTQSVYTWDR